MSKMLTETLNLTTGEPQINTAPDTRHNIVMAPTSEEANGTIKFKIHEVKFLDDSPRTGKMELYCKIGLGWHNEEASCTKSHVITLQRKHGEETAKVTVKDRTKGILRDHIGDGHVDLNDVASKGTVTQWYNLVHGENIVAQILLTVDFIASGDTSLA